MRDDDVSITDLRIVVDEKTGIADLAWYAGDLQLVEGTANLQQALMLRILVGRGELRELGHSRYGSHVSELIGEPLDKTNLELLRRYVRQALRADPRVTEVTRVVVQPRRDAPGIVDVDVAVKASNGEELQLGLALDLG